MAEEKLYEDIALRTGGNIYIGVVGPVRTGKSTFIKRFMETMVIPNIDNVYARERAKDELPQSGSGKTVMTSEPKFVPEEAVHMQLSRETSISVRLIDCVGYMIPGAAGIMENDMPRMVATPWFDQEIDIVTAAEEGTLRVIRDHSTVGLLVTTDGSICGIPREDYIEAEERVAAELQKIGKPFMIVLNSTEPHSPKAQALSKELSVKYGVSCVCVSCLSVTQVDIELIMQQILNEFPVEEFAVYLPEWTQALSMDHPLKKHLFELISLSSCTGWKLRDRLKLLDQLLADPEINSAEIFDVASGLGRFSVKIELPRELYYRTLSEESGLEINSDADLIELLCSMSAVKADYDRISQALIDVRETGYGVVLPSQQEMVLKEPEIVRQGGRYSVMLRANAPAIHMLRTNVETEVAPAVGGENASEEILGFLLQNFEGDASKIWESNIFGKSLYDIAIESLNGKLTKMPRSTGMKLRGVLQRIVNEGGGGLICIIL